MASDAKREAIKMATTTVWLVSPPVPLLTQPRARTHLSYLALHLDATTTIMETMGTIQTTIKCHPNIKARKVSINMA